MGDQFNYKFGAGVLFVTPSNTNQSIQIGECQGVTLSSKRDLKQLYGQNAFAVDAALGKADVTGKIDFARITPEALNLHYSSTLTSGSSKQGNRETFTIPKTGGYTVTVANAAKFDHVLGVNILQANSTVKQMILVSGTPEQGQYSVASGIFTFNAADKGIIVEIHYISTNTTGTTIATLNPLLGEITEYKLDLYQNYKAGSLLATIPRVIIPSLSLDFKLDDFTIPAVDFTVIATPATGPIIFYM